MKIKHIDIKKPMVLGNDMGRVIMIRSVVCSCGWQFLPTFDLDF